MSAHQVQKDRRSRLRSLVPFGLLDRKPRHFRDMASILWQNRDNLGYAWKVLSRGVCDGCALGVAGFHDWTIKGTHLCMTRLNLLRLNTMPELAVSQLDDVSRLEQLSNAELRALGRLPYPMIRQAGAKRFRRISWDDAYARIARRIVGADPKRIAFFLTSRGVTNEVYYMAQKASRFLGTNNVDNAARLCHAPSTAAMKHAVGVAATTCSYKDWYGTDLIIFFGANPANDQPVTTKYLHEAKQLGTKVVMVNPYLEPGMTRYWVPSTASSALFGTDIADYWFPVSQGGDIAFIYGVLKVILENGWEDKRFTKEFSVGIEDLRSAAGAFDWQTIEQQSGLKRASMVEFAELIHRAKNAVVVWSMGITQHAFGADAVQMVLNLGLIKGFVGRDKCGLMPIRGHSSVQGGAEMGAYATAFPGGKPVNRDNAAWLAEQYGFEIPDWVGMTGPEMVEASARGNLDLLYCLGGNFLRTLPEPDYVRAAMANVPLRVHQDIILTDQVFIPAREEVILLPAKTRYEQDDGGTETTTERRIIFSPEIPRQVGEAKAEWKILRELAARCYPERANLLGCETGWAMREEIARVVPFYNGFQHLRKTGDAYQYGGPHLCADWKFPTSDGKAHFKPVPLPNVSRKPGEFEVSTRRGKQFNTLIYAEIDPLNGAPRDAVLINPEDAAHLHLANSDRIALCNDLGRYQGRVFLAPIAPGNLQIHWPEGNVIIPHGIYDKAGGVPDYNTRVTIEKL
ncbi:MAG TPA: FdhF/YdeP family oxidoreductase [Candidatus Kapabacteria bacterium]|nr:FdhF/YdeP family oxidoreductase [Candidatus Kapabacteria bacterium]